MPAVKDLKTADYRLLVWKIEEDYSFFANQIILNYSESQELSYMVNEYRKLEWLATRFVQRQVIKDTILKDEYGKPSLERKGGYISIAHCRNFAAVIYSKEAKVGLDIEPINEKVLKIANKFLSEEEQTLLEGEMSVTNYIAAWCVKEAVYKWFGKKNLSFKQNIRIESLSVENQKALVAFSKEDMHENLALSIDTIEDVVLSFLVRK